MDKIKFKSSQIQPVFALILFYFQIYTKLYEIMDIIHIFSTKTFILEMKCQTFNFTVKSCLPCIEHSQTKTNLNNNIKFIHFIPIFSLFIQFRLTATQPIITQHKIPITQQFPQHSTSGFVTGNGRSSSIWCPLLATFNHEMSAV